MLAAPGGRSYHVVSVRELVGQAQSKHTSVVQRPATFLMKIAISSFSMVPEPSLSNSLKHCSKSSSENSPESFISERVFCTNFLVSSLSREPELSLSYSAQMSSTHFLITASMSAICSFLVLKYNYSPC